MERQAGGRRPRVYRGEAAPGLEVYVVRVEGPHDPSRIAELGRQAYVAGFIRDPGPCRVAVAALHVWEERASGEARVRSPGLHLRMAAEGLKQLRDLPEPPEIFLVAYAAAAGRDEALQLCRLLVGTSECPGEEPLECSRDSLEDAFKTVVASRVERL